MTPRETFEVLAQLVLLGLVVVVGGRVLDLLNKRIRKLTQ